MTTLTAPPAVLYRQAFSIDPTHPASTDLTQLHKSVMGCFPSTPNNPTYRAENNILFAANRTQPRWARSRTDRPHLGAATHVLIQATTPPTQAGHGLTPTSDTFTTSHTFEEGDQVDIATLVNPTKSVATEPGTRGRRISLTHHHEIRDWMTRKLAPAVTLDPDMAIGTPTRGTSSTHITIDLCDITARGTITNPTALTELITTGIGRGRAYGAGLIRTRPTPD